MKASSFLTAIVIAVSAALYFAAAPQGVSPETMHAAALGMGATSVRWPFIYMPAGPTLRGNWHGEHLGSGTDRWRY